MFLPVVLRGSWLTVTYLLRLEAGWLARRLVNPKSAPYGRPILRETSHLLPVEPDTSSGAVQRDGPDQWFSGGFSACVFGLE